MRLFRRQPAEPATEPAGARPSRFRTVVGIEAMPDTANIGRICSLQGTIGNGLNGRLGGAVGHDVGAPERSLPGPVPSRPSAVSEAIAGVAHRPQAMPEPGYADQLTTQPVLDPYNALLWARFVNQS